MNQRFRIKTAGMSDINQLLSLYFLIYGNSYPFAMCTDRASMEAAIASNDIYWLVAYEVETSKIIASGIFELDRLNKIGKLTGVVVDPQYRKEGLAYVLIEQGSTFLLDQERILNSIYATTRTLSVGPQLMCMKAGYRAFGIFPNSHRLTQFETTTLLIRYGENVLQKRGNQEFVLAPIVPIFEIANKSLGETEQRYYITLERMDVCEPQGTLDFEIIDAPHYVKKKFDERFTDPYDRYFPFHVPNIIAASTGGEVEIFAHLNKRDGYCAIVALSSPIYELRGNIDSLLNRLGDLGISYIEVLVSLNRLKSIQTLLDKQFLPSAIYPCMREDGEQLQDFIVLSRTMEPLSFKGMAIERQFKPFIDQYVSIWKQFHLDSLQVFDDYK